ncbi:MAG: cytochrome C, partial [Candidatus Omnitrophica bacterium]|nr:cytochrome C [Candidatus Omnitrophota bacterium]
MTLRIHLCILIVIAISSHAADFPEIYDTEKGEIPRPACDEILSKWDIPEGFNIQLFASDPMVRQPIHITTDERGRLWVCENYTYAESGVRFAKDLRDRILILEDVDGDGVADNRKVFWEGGQKLTSVE